MDNDSDNEKDEIISGENNKEEKDFEIKKINS
jgi:hypothetical protein